MGLFITGTLLANQEQRVVGEEVPKNQLIQTSAGQDAELREAATGMSRCAVDTAQNPTTYENTSVIAVDNSEALKKVKKWMASFECVADDAWLQITLNGVGIRSLQPGEF